MGKSNGNDQRQRHYSDYDLSDPVVYYRSGDLNGEQASMGAISFVREPGLVELHIFQRQKPNAEVILMCYHTDHPALVENPKLRQKYGVWDSPENHHARQVGKKESRKAQAQKESEARAARTDAMRAQNKAVEERVLELKAKGMNSTEIADTLGEGFTPERVQTVLRRALQRTGA